MADRPAATLFTAEAVPPKDKSPEGLPEQGNKEKRPKARLVIPEDPLKGVPPKVRLLKKKWGVITREVEPAMMSCMWAGLDTELAAILGTGKGKKKAECDPTELTTDFVPLLSMPFVEPDDEDGFLQPLKDLPRPNRCCFYRCRWEM